MMSFSAKGLADQIAFCWLTGDRGLSIRGASGDHPDGHSGGPSSKSGGGGGCRNRRMVHLYRHLRAGHDLRRDRCRARLGRTGGEGGDPVSRPVAFSRTELTDQAAYGVSVAYR